VYEHMGVKMETKICNRCNETKPLYDFGKNNRYNDGKHKICKRCLLTCNRQAYDKHTIKSTTPGPNTHLDINVVRKIVRKNTIVFKNKLLAESIPSVVVKVRYDIVPDKKSIINDIDWQKSCIDASCRRNSFIDIADIDIEENEYVYEYHHWINRPSTYSKH